MMALIPAWACAQFNTTASTWSTPVGGKLNGGTHYGYVSTLGLTSGNDVTSESWSVMDINGDGKPDLIVTAQLGSGNNTVQFGATSNAYWKVYLGSSLAFRVQLAPGLHL
jgi:hypothetical protein